MGVTGAAINKAVQKIASAVGIPTQREGSKVNCSEAQRGRNGKLGEADEEQLDLSLDFPVEKRRRTAREFPS
jgi:hypothetical protein